MAGGGAVIRLMVQCDMMWLFQSCFGYIMWRGWGCNTDEPKSGPSRTVWQFRFTDHIANGYTRASTIANGYTHALP